MNFLSMFYLCGILWGNTQASEIQFGTTDYTAKKYVVGSAINKLGELEDVLEKYGIESAEELKRKAIIPKFQVGQEIWYIFGNEIRSMVVSTIEATKNLICYHNFKGDVVQWELNCFATKEEVEKKLAKIRREE